MKYALVNVGRGVVKDVIFFVLLNRFFEGVFAVPVGQERFFHLRKTLLWVYFFEMHRMKE